MLKFRVGDRVQCRMEGDYGTITRPYSETSSTCWWVKWDSGGELWARDDEMDLVTRHGDDDLAKAIKLLVDNGYVVTLGAPANTTPSV